MSVWTPELLDALRLIGDPLLDKRQGFKGWEAVPVAGVGAGRRPTPGELLQIWRTAREGARPTGADRRNAYWTLKARDMRARDLDVAHSLFGAYGGEIGASLLLASLPNAYAASAGAAVLASTGELESHARRRIGETAQLVIDVLYPSNDDRLREVREALPSTMLDPFPRGQRGHWRILTTRLTHAVIRQLLKGKGWNSKEPGLVPTRAETLRGVPINQEDLLGTLGTFTVTTMGVMERLGVAWNSEAELAYLRLWDRVGELLGIGTKRVIEQLPLHLQQQVNKSHAEGLRPQTVAEAKELQELIRQRVWPLPPHGTAMGPFDNANGKILVRALLDELQAAMPRGLERLPLQVMRYLVNPVAHELLGLGGGGVPDSLMLWPGVESFRRGARPHTGTSVIERSMRFAASEISRRAFIHFIRERKADKSQADFWFPLVPFEDTRISAGRGGAN